MSLTRPGPLGMFGFFSAVLKNGIEAITRWRRNRIFWHGDVGVDAMEAYSPISMACLS